jgi:hypothetical protein
MGGFSQIWGQPEKIQVKTSKKISRNRPIFKNLITLALDIDFWFAIIIIDSPGWVLAPVQVNFLL